MTDSVKIHFKKKNCSDKSKTAKIAETDAKTQAQRDEIDKKAAAMPKEHGGRSKDKGLEPTRYGDWELKGRCVDF